MRKIAQRFCRCGAKSRGFCHDARSDMWVCGRCKLPWEQYYLKIRSEQPDGVKIKYAKGLEFETTVPLKSQRGTASPRRVRK